MDTGSTKQRRKKQQADHGDGMGTTIGIRSERSIYQLLERYLREAPYSMTCVNLMDHAEIRREALKEYGGESRDVRVATNKISDLLGFM